MFPNNGFYIIFKNKHHSLLSSVLLNSWNINLLNLHLVPIITRGGPYLGSFTLSSLAVQKEVLVLASLNRKVQGANIHYFPATTTHQIPMTWLTRMGELSSFDPQAEPIRPEWVLRTWLLTGRTGQNRQNEGKQSACKILQPLIMQESNLLAERHTSRYTYMYM